MVSSRLTATKALVPQLESALNTFVSSKAGFHVVRTIRPHKPDAASSTAENGTALSSNQTRTLFILDSSYNPPSRAHMAMARNALLTAQQETKPHRLLLLFSTHNADKKDVKPSQFVNRIAMMILFAQDLQEELYKEKIEELDPLEIDVGLTSSPYYTDKSLAIMNAPSAERYPLNPTHVHLLGYDTVTRFLAPKYYPEYDPPLSAVAPYFEHGHKLRVLLRPNSSSINTVEGDSVQDQKKWIDGLGAGDLEKEGFKPAWASQVGILERNADQAEGISSTRIREAAKKGNWDEVGKLCSLGVTEWVKEMDLYGEEKP